MIDVAYVNRVLAGLDAVMGDSVRMVAKAGSLTPDSIDRVKAIYVGPILDSQLNYLIKDSAAGFPGLPPSPGNRKTTVTSLLSAQSKCVFARVARDYSKVSVDARTDIGEQYVGLQTLDRARDTNNYNPTGWTIIYDGFQKDRSKPPDPCATAS